MQARKIPSLRMQANFNRISEQDIAIQEAILSQSVVNCCEGGIDLIKSLTGFDLNISKSNIILQRNHGNLFCNQSQEGDSIITFAEYEICREKLCQAILSIKKLLSCLINDVVGSDSVGKLEMAISRNNWSTFLEYLLSEGVNNKPSLPNDTKCLIDPIPLVHDIAVTSKVQFDIAKDLFHSDDLPTDRTIMNLIFNAFSISTIGVQEIEHTNILQKVLQGPETAATLHHSLFLTRLFVLTSLRLAQPPVHQQKKQPIHRWKGILQSLQFSFVSYRSGCDGNNHCQNDNLKDFQTLNQLFQEHIYAQLADITDPTTPLDLSDVEVDSATQHSQHFYSTNRSYWTQLCAYEHGKHQQLWAHYDNSNKRSKDINKKVVYEQEVEESAGDRDDPAHLLHQALVHSYGDVEVTIRFLVMAMGTTPTSQRKEINLLFTLEKKGQTKEQVLVTNVRLLHDATNVWSGKAPDLGPNLIDTMAVHVKHWMVKDRMILWIILMRLLTLFSTSSTAPQTISNTTTDPEKNAITVMNVATRRENDDEGGGAGGAGAGGGAGGAGGAGGGGGNKVGDEEKEMLQELETLSLPSTAASDMEVDGDEDKDENSNDMEIGHVLCESAYSYHRLPNINNSNNNTNKNNIISLASSHQSTPALSPTDHHSANITSTTNNTANVISKILQWLRHQQLPLLMSDTFSLLPIHPIASSDPHYHLLSSTSTSSAFTLVKYLLQKTLPKYLVPYSFFDGRNLFPIPISHANHANHDHEFILRYFLPGNVHFAFHQANRSSRVDANLGPGVQYYVVVEACYVPLFQEYLATYKLIDPITLPSTATGGTETAWQHLIPPVEWLFEAGIPYTTGCQYPGDIMLLKHDVMYWEYSLNQGSSKHLTWHLLPLHATVLYSSLTLHSQYQLPRFTTIIPSSTTTTASSSVLAVMPRVPLDPHLIPFFSPFPAATASTSFSSFFFPFQAFLYHLVVYCVEHLPVEYRQKHPFPVSGPLARKKTYKVNTHLITALVTCEGMLKAMLLRLYRMVYEEERMVVLMEKVLGLTILQSTNDCNDLHGEENGWVCSRVDCGREVFNTGLYCMDGIDAIDSNDDDNDGIGGKGKLLCLRCAYLVPCSATCNHHHTTSINDNDPEDNHQQHDEDVPYSHDCEYSAKHYRSDLWSSYRKQDEGSVDNNGDLKVVEITNISQCTPSPRLPCAWLSSPGLYYFHDDTDFLAPYCHNHQQQPHALSAAIRGTAITTTSARSSSQAGKKRKRGGDPVVMMNQIEEEESVEELEARYRSVLWTVTWPRLQCHCNVHHSSCTLVQHQSLQTMRIHWEALLDYYKHSFAPSQYRQLLTNCEELRYRVEEEIGDALGIVFH